MKDSSRAIRRHHVARLKNNRKNYYGTNRVYGTEGITQMTPDRLGKVSQYPKDCSCPMCGNPRKHFSEITCKEKIHIIEHIAYLKASTDDMI